MKQPVKNADGTFTIDANQLKLLVEANRQYQADIERSVLVISGVLKVLGIINKDGSFKEDFRFRHMLQSLMKIVSSATLGGGGLEKQFGFAVDPANVEMLERYAYTFRDAGPKQIASAVDIDPSIFE